MSDSILIDPQVIGEWSKEQLVEAYTQTSANIEVLTAQKSALKDVLLEKIQGDGEIVGEYTVSRAKMYNWYPELEAKDKLAKAKEIGAVVEQIDKAKLKKLWMKGVEIPFSTVEYIIVRAINKTKDIKVEK